MTLNTFQAFEPLVSLHQRKILENARPAVFFYINGKRAGLISNTEKARQWAIEKHGATHFSMFSFHRFNMDGKPSSYLVGDFFCVIRYRKDQHIGSSPILQFVVSVLVSTFKLYDLSACKLIYLGGHSLGLALPASVFGIKHGSKLLPYMYKIFSDEISRAAQDYYAGIFEIQYNTIVAAENRKIDSGSYTTPFFLSDVECFSERFLNTLSKNPSVYPMRKCTQTINDDILRDLARIALREWKKKSSKIRDNFSDTSAPIALDASSGMVPMFNPDRQYSAVKCARKLVSWLQTKGINEFSRRDASIGADERLDGKSGNGGGVSDALETLMAHGYIKECPFLPLQFFCGRPSPWYVVNPNHYFEQAKIMPRN